jgi:hypothetical protein
MLRLYNRHFYLDRLLDNFYSKIPDENRYICYFYYLAETALIPRLTLRSVR